MNKLIVFLLFVFTLQACEYKMKKQDSSKGEIQLVEPRTFNEINALTDTMLSINKVEKKNDLLFDLEGKYTFNDDISGCKISLKLFYRNGLLRYKIETNNRKLSGNAKIELNEEKDGYYITFLKIEWSEYLGVIDPEDGASEEDLPLPQDVGGVLYENEITIQNNGNSMNYYVKLGECGVKYIHLTK